MTDRLSGLRYTGGKSVLALTGVGRWVASLLPAADLFCEPFAGMLGVLLQRAPARREVANDINSHVFNWWLVVADPELCAQLAVRLQATPSRSEPHFDAACDFLSGWDSDGLPDGEAAYWWTIQTCMAAYAGEATFGNRLGDTRGYLPSPGKLERLRRRMRDVLLLNRDAVAVIEQVGEDSEGLIYCDPPYPSVRNRHGHEPDFGAMAEALSAAVGKVAISGQEGDRWEERLSGRWWQQRFETTRPAAQMSGLPAPPVVECLWTNYDPDSVRRNLRLFDE